MTLSALDFLSTNVPPPWGLHIRRTKPIAVEALVACIFAHIPQRKRAEHHPRIEASDYGSRSTVQSSGHGDASKHQIPFTGTYFRSPSLPMDIYRPSDAPGAANIAPAAPLHPLMARHIPPNLRQDSVTRLTHITPASCELGRRAT